jgi:hypothetical protein
MNRAVARTWRAIRFVVTLIVLPLMLIALMEWLGIAGPPLAE